MKIGSITLSSPTVLAPLAGITNLPFRLIAKENGCGLVCSEMISSNGLVYHSGKTHTMLESVAEEKPLSVQIFGSDPLMMAEAAAMVGAHPVPTSWISTSGARSKKCLEPVPERP